MTHATLIIYRSVLFSADRVRAIAGYEGFAS